MANVTWDSATVTAVTLSGGNLVATNTGTTSADQGARVATVNGKTSGKYYFEITLTNLGSGGINRGLGIGTVTSTYTNLGGSSVTGSIMYPGGGNIWTFGTGNTGISLGSRSTGNIIGVAVDLDNSRIWFRVAPSGNWNNSGTASPATNTGGITAPAGSGAIVPFCTFGGITGVAGVSFTANFGDAAFTGAVPSGFTAGWAAPTIGGDRVQAAVSVNAR